VPEGDFRLGAEFNAAVTEASTDTAAFVVPDLSKKLAQASHILMQKTKADADLRVKSATEKLSLSERLRRAEAEVLALRDENAQLKGKCTRLEATARDNEKVLENLRKTVEDDANEKNAPRVRLRSWRQFKLGWRSSRGCSRRLPLRPTQCTKSTGRLLLSLERSLCSCLSRSKVPKFSFSFWTGCYRSSKGSEK